MADGKLAEMESGGERKRKRGVEASSSSSSSSSSEVAAAAAAKWKTEGEQRTYSSKLIAALHRVRSAALSPADRARSRAVREAADRALAVAARGRTRWSRAILLSSKILPSLKRRRVLLRRATFRPKPIAAPAAAERSSSRPPALEKKTRILGQLVPGCRKLPLPSLLEEVSDYIAALQMQVRSMSAIAQVLSASGTGTPSPPPPPPPPPM